MMEAINSKTGDEMSIFQNPAAAMLFRMDMEGGGPGMMSKGLMGNDEDGDGNIGLKSNAPTPTTKEESEVLSRLEDKVEFVNKKMKKLKKEYENYRKDNYKFKNSNENLDFIQEKLKKALKKA
jgi:hypothetical protein